MSSERRDADRRVLGEATRRLRQQAQLTQKQLAELADADDTYISRVEHGRIDIGWSTLLRLLRALDTDLHALATIIDELERSHKSACE